MMTESTAQREVWIQDSRVTSGDLHAEINTKVKWLKTGCFRTNWLPCSWHTKQRYLILESNFIIFTESFDPAYMINQFSHETSSIENSNDRFQIQTQKSSVANIEYWLHKRRLAPKRILNSKLFENHRLLLMEQKYVSSWIRQSHFYSE